MSYLNPVIPLISNPSGLDKKIEEIRSALLSGCPWLGSCFHRAWLFQEKDGGGALTSVSKVPKAYEGSKEYIDVRPNDNLTTADLKAYAFFFATGYEKVLGNQASGILHKTRDLCVIFWGNLKNIDPTKDYIFTEELKMDIEKAFNNVSFLTRNSYIDDRYDLIFKEFTLNDVDGQYLMYPYFGCRFDITVSYNESLC